MKVGDLVRKNPEVWRIEDCQQFGIITKALGNMLYVTFLGEKVWKSAYAEYELEVIDECR